MTTCPSCERTEERTERGWRPIRLKDGICAACTDARDEVEAMKREATRH